MKGDTSLRYRENGSSLSNDGVSVPSVTPKKKSISVSRTSALYVPRHKMQPMLLVVQPMIWHRAEQRVTNRFPFKEDYCLFRAPSRLPRL